MDIYAQGKIVTIAATDIFPTFGVAIPPSIIWLQLSLILILILGIGCIIVSRDLSNNYGIVIIERLAKVMFLVLSLIYFIVGDVNITIVLLGGIDIIFVCLFIEFLKNHK